MYINSSLVGTPSLLNFDVCTDSQSKSTIVNIATAEETRQMDDWYAENTDGRRYG